MSCPFEIKPEKPNGKAVLLIHGFLASPYIMRSIGEFMAAHGYLVRAILLPGHGTDFNQLRTVKYQDWLDVCRDAIRSIQSECGIDNISIIGFSLGATLALLMSFEFKISALGLISPCFGISSTAKTFPLLCHLKMDKILPDLGCTQSQPINHASYQRFPICAVAEVQKVITLYQQKGRLQKTWPRIFGAMSLDDQTVKPEATLAAFKHFPPESSCLKIYRGAEFKNAPEIKSLSHVALPASPQDPYFGKNGRYYGKLPPDTPFGEPTWRDKGKPLKRLTYHPDFDLMMNALLACFNTP
ncbi:MAG: alpha/beta fold hydrolase [Gammaproteobacteria bacterium]|nr:alpha/beta fold hydrolase [Gammaproteobacteria bacterium]